MPLALLQDMIQVGGPSRAKTPDLAEDSADKLTWVRNLGTWSKGLGDVLEKSGLDKSAQDNIKFVLSGGAGCGLVAPDVLFVACQ